MAGSRTVSSGLLLAAAALLSLHPAHGLYFFITDGQQRCFIEEVPAETLIVGTYKSPDFVPFGRTDFTGVVSWKCQLAAGPAARARPLRIHLSVWLEVRGRR